MRPNRYTLLLSGALLALVFAPAAHAQYGTGVVQQVPRATGAITLDGVANEAAWSSAVTIDLTTVWDGAWSGHPDPDITATALALWNDGVLYLYVRNEDYQEFFWGTDGNPWGGEQILVGVDLPHLGGPTDGGFGGWPENAPNLGPTAYKITGADGEGTAGITSNWGGGPDPIANGWVDGHVFIDNTNFVWGVEMAIYGAEMALGGEIGFGIGGATASVEQADGGDDGAYAYYGWQVCSDPGPDSFCQYAGGNVMSDAEGFATLRFENVVANEGGAAAAGYALRSSGPNPFRGATALTYEIARTGTVDLAAYDALGRRVAVLDAGTRTAGEHHVAFDAAALPAGVYTVRLVADGSVVAYRRVSQIR